LLCKTNSLPPSRHQIPPAVEDAKTRRSQDYGSLDGLTHLIFVQQQLVNVACRLFTL
jgi:hypothetical protein